MQTSLDPRIKHNKWLRRFTVMTQILLAIAFLPSGLTKVVGNRFTPYGAGRQLDWLLL